MQGFQLLHSSAQAAAQWGDHVSDTHASDLGDTPLGKGLLTDCQATGDSHVGWA